GGAGGGGPPRGARRRHLQGRPGPRRRAAAAGEGPDRGRGPQPARPRSAGLLLRLPVQAVLRRGGDSERAARAAARARARPDASDLMGLQRVLLGGFLLVLILAPLPFGSVVPWARTALA